MEVGTEFSFFFLLLLWEGRESCACGLRSTYIYMSRSLDNENIFSFIYAIEIVIPREVGMEFYCCGIFLDTQRFLLVFPWGVPSYYYYMDGGFM
jgi:hypothetical protein